MKFFFSYLLLISLRLPVVAYASGSELLNPSDTMASMAAFKIVYQEDVHRKSCDELLGSNWFIADQRFGSAKIAAQTMNYNLKQVEGGEELLRIFKLASSAPEDFRHQLDFWLLKRGQIRAITVSELRDFLSQNKSLDFPVFDSPEDEARGFISHKAFTFAFSQGFFPMGDPHDLFFHIPAFLDPRFGDSLKRIAKLIFETTGRPEYQMLFNYLTGVLREIGVENWSYLIADPTNNKPFLFLQGNKPFFAINDLKTQFDQNLISSFVNVRNVNHSAFDFKDFPNWKKFSQREDIAANVKKLETMLKSIEIPSDYAARADRRLREELGDTIEVEDFLPKFADFVNRDPVLKRAYSIENRGQAAILLLDLLENYWNWIQTEGGSSS